MENLRLENIETIEALLLQHREWLVTLCVRKARGDYEEARDLVQDIMLHVCVHRDEMPDGDRSRERWLYSIARNVLFLHGQRKQRRPILVSLHNEPADDISDKLRAEELMALAREALNDDELNIIRQRLDGYTYDEIGAATGHTGAAMRKQMERIISKIRTYHNIKT